MPKEETVCKEYSTGCWSGSECRVSGCWSDLSLPEKEPSRIFSGRAGGSDRSTSSTRVETLSMVPTPLSL